MIKHTAYQLIEDCLKWEAHFSEDENVPERFAEMSAAMCRVARYVRTGKL